MNATTWRCNSACAGRSGASAFVRRAQDRRAVERPGGPVPGPRPRGRPSITGKVAFDVGHEKEQGADCSFHPIQCHNVFGFGHSPWLAHSRRVTTGLVWSYGDISRVFPAPRTSARSRTTSPRPPSMPPCAVPLALGPAAPRAVHPADPGAAHAGPRRGRPCAWNGPRNGGRLEAFASGAWGGRIFHRRPSPRWVTVPTTACPPFSTVTRPTRTTCVPLER